jgi:hypothetical protein
MIRMTVENALEIIVSMLKGEPHHRATINHLQAQFVSPPANRPNDAFMAGMKLGLALGELHIENSMVFLGPPQAEEPPGID